MQYRNFGRDNFQVSALGFGCMRLPTTDGKPNGPVDVPEAIRMIRYGIDNGINYIDTAKVYHEETCEEIVGKALADGYREKVWIATKLPVWSVQSIADCDRILAEELRDLRTDVIDVYLLHNMQMNFWNIAQRLDLVNWAVKQKEAGKIRHIGFSFHDSFPFFQTVVDAFDWDMCMIQYNCVNENHQAGQEGLRYAHGKGIPVVAMEPLFGGFLANPTGKIGEMFRESNYDPVDLSLRWVWDQPEISLLLSGMSSMSQVKQNLEIADRSRVNGLTDDERNFIRAVQKEYENSVPIKCTKCRYCVPCPQGVDIPHLFDTYNLSRAFPEKKDFYQLIYSMLSPNSKADQCNRCGTCEEKCPQKLPIRDDLAMVHSYLSGN